MAVVRAKRVRRWTVVLVVAVLGALGAAAPGASATSQGDHARAKALLSAAKGGELTPLTQAVNTHLQVQSPVSPVVAQRSAPLSSLAPPPSGPKEAARTIRSSSAQLGQTFSGLDDTANRAPSDPDIAVGPSSLFEIAEPDFQIFSLSGAALSSPAASTVLWTGQTSPCAVLTSGDWSQVIYDQLANQFVYTRTVHPEIASVASADECIAVSETSNPTGSWYLYTVPLISGNQTQTDYPQLGFSAQAYYLGANLWTGAGGSGQFEGDLLEAFNRSELLSGQPLQVASATLSSAYETFVPTTLEGTTPAPTGVPEYFFGGPSDFLIANGGASSQIETFAVTPTWGSGGSSSTLSVQGPNNLSIGAYNDDICGAQEACAPQPNTTTELETWSDNLMLPIVYRNFGSYQSIVATFDVNHGGVASPEWFEFRRSGSGAAQLYQEGVYAPTSASRYEQSVNEDNSGDIALAYTISSSTIYPSLAATVRTPSTPLGSLGNEFTLWSGGAAQTASSPGLSAQQNPSRWGDASYLTLAPNGCTFWYANTYYPNASSVWQTAIASFSVPGCVASSTTKNVDAARFSSGRGA